MPNTNIKARAFFYDRIADSLDSITNPYDIQTRLAIVFERLLSERDLSGKLVLDVGSGTGSFSQGASAAGARVVSLDIGTHLLKKVKERCRSSLIGADACRLPFRDRVFDIVISSECVEHTLDPMLALREMHRVLRPSGTLVVTTPNRFWKFSLFVANLLRARPYDGFENWISWGNLERHLTKLNMQIDSMFGFHLFPPIFDKSWPLLRGADRFGEIIGPIMLNIAVKAKKR